MSGHAYPEDQQAQRTLTQLLPRGGVVEQPAIGLIAELGWQHRWTRELLLPRLLSGQEDLRPN